MKIYDCFTFFNELDLLELRLNILNNQVDYFVLVEATKSHSGSKKELYFKNNQERFKAFLHKIIYIVVDDLPKLVSDNRWLLENFQRNAIMRGLSNCHDDDFIIISDLDEIPDLDNIDNLKNILKINSSKIDFLYDNYIKLKYFFSNLETNSKIIRLIQKIINKFYIKSKRLIVFQQKLYYYYLNGLVDNNWLGSRAILYKNLITQYHSSPQQIRDSFGEIVIHNSGWHFSYLADAQGIAKKLNSFCHSECDKLEYTDINSIQKKIINGEDLFGRKQKINYIKIDNSYPKYILKNIEKYSSHIKQII